MCVLIESDCLSTGRNGLILRAIVVFIEAHSTFSCQNWLSMQMKSLGIFRAWISTRRINYWSYTAFVTFLHFRCRHSSFGATLLALRDNSAVITQHFSIHTFKVWTRSIYRTPNIQFGIYHFQIETTFPFFTIVWRCIVTDSLWIKPNRCTEFQFYWYYYSTCFGQPFCSLSGVLSRTSALVHFMQLWPFATKNMM
jgi:hypothetical protein